MYAQRSGRPRKLRSGPLLVLLAALWGYPAFAQADIMGLWRPLPRNQDGSGMIGDIAGIPVTEGDRARVASWSPEDFDTTEFACRPHSWDYSLEGPLSPIRFWAEIDQATQKLIAYHGHINQEEQEVTIWMDGRPHPPEAALHTWSGFSTGEWDGDVLVVTTTHLKETYIRRNGLMHSDRATVRTRWRRMGDYLQATSILYDPVYMTEPYVRSTMMWVNDPTMKMDPYPCEEATETAIERGTVPHFLPGKSALPALDKGLTDRFGTPYEPRLGGAVTMYPEYITKMKSMPHPPKVATGVSEGQP
jgi:hypothetical protein